ncbi:bis(5'-nucleosyl)-tetraphosphatase (symmetrical) [Limnohabitans sp. T6-5]|uniref:symmetrical bis(5'-nucleosyl)-tetraphosphatase n=1 Tax=Limnohabitans sp. T6-5 TaxID=1100724 RepID=UPI000D34237C|nr:symmetrical bis(5'-nucleosyl)-tetraphosphatase [Limnohabitans sp. T6-5]PUE09610.1 bis(5'-nucleosyl)-tetraphosphatase (symmetrical) [Limnohabitans sp. T6-5]
MSIYWVGDIQGCDAPLARLLGQVDFSPSRDTLFVLGDLVNRGPDSAGVLRRLMAFGGSVQCVLGNHDLHLLAVAAGAGRIKPMDTLDGILQAPDRSAMLDWLRHQRMAIWAHDVLMVHAGVLPSWTASQTLTLAAEVEQVLRGPELPAFLHQMYGNEPAAWQDDLTGMSRLRVIVNALTRLRFCSADGVMEFAAKEGANTAPAGFMPWFDVPGRQTAGLTVAFGHWSTLGKLDRPNVWALDTGCVWGGCLSAMRRDDQGQQTLLEVKCPPAQRPS